MKYGVIGALVPSLFDKTAYGYTAKALPDMDMKAFIYGIIQVSEQFAVSFDFLYRRITDVTI